MHHTIYAVTIEISNSHRVTHDTKDHLKLATQNQIIVIGITCVMFLSHPSFIVICENILFPQ